ncbi:hypothetical protein GQ464_016735 [Rhodocaloribacter litoris]|uniref:hypothetical protein n=1 Tax=Rhodocaloribacter litoris TaxID=2558931 RepID=UPI001E34A214|nr:hypothetical protein [Rhodocaloribacter litoris]QXD15031.1 hypothetical protein GQ464_016735 [Rhodocaloribacter litoris]
MLRWTLVTIAAAVVIAGFWNYHVVDGFGRDVVAGRTIGDTSRLAQGYDAYGAGFGFLFAAIAGLAATFTACNCVVFAMLPGLICSTDRKRQGARPWRALGAFVAGVLVVCAAYGLYVGTLGAEGVAAYNERGARLAQAQTVFTTIGLVMLVWGIVELGFAGALVERVALPVRAFFGTTTAKAGIIGTLVGLFAVGRPFPVFREFLTYAASAESPLYGAGVMMVQGLGQIAVMAVLFAVMVWLGGRRLVRWAAEKPHQPVLLSGLALVAGGTFFVFYWGLAFALDIGRWGFKLGWY